MPLEEVVQDILVYADMLVETARAQKSVASMGKLCNDISRYYRCLGICSLLINANPDDFFHGLIQSALTRKYYLKRCVQENHLDDPARKVSFVDPFLDAVAANQFPLAGQIGELSPTEWLEDYEYEDDFAYARFLQTLVRFDPDVRPDLEQIYNRYEAALEGNPDVRLNLCKALLDVDQDEFNESFTALLDAHEERGNEIADPKTDSILSLDYTFEPNRWICVEGLAILRLAEKLELQTDEEYKFCPSIARVTDYKAFVPDSFPFLSLED